MSTIASEIAAGNGIKLAEAAKLFPSNRQGKAVTLSCIFRWIFGGIAGPDGQRVRLEGARLGGKWLTTPQAIARFIGRQTPVIGDPLPAPRSPAQRQRAEERAKKELKKIRIY